MNTTTAQSSRRSPAQRANVLAIQKRSREKLRRDLRVQRIKKEALKKCIWLGPTAVSLLEAYRFSPFSHRELLSLAVVDLLADRPDADVLMKDLVSEPCTEGCSHKLNPVAHDLVTSYAPRFSGASLATTAVVRMLGPRPSNSDLLAKRAKHSALLGGNLFRERALTPGQLNYAMGQ